MTTHPFSLYRLSFYLRAPRTLGECIDYCHLLELAAPGFIEATPLTAMEYNSPQHFVGCWARPYPDGSNHPDPETAASANWWVEMIGEMRRYGR